MKYGTLHQILNPMTVKWPKIEIFKIQDGGGRHLENRFFGHYSSTNCPISAKFCMRKQNGMSIRATGQKMQSFKIQDGGRPPFWKSLNRHISVKNYPISMKFGTLQQMLNPIAVEWPKIESFKIQDGGDRHLENRFFGRNSSTDCPISAKFCVRKHNRMPKRPREKLQIFKIQMADGRHFENRYIAICQWTRGQSNLTKSASRGAHSPVRGHPRGSKVVPLNSWGRVSY